MKPLDWRDVPREELNPLLARRVLHTATMTVALLDMKKGALVPVHSHVNEQVSLVQNGRLKFLVEGQEVIIGPGQVMQLASGLPHGVEVLEDSVVLDVFSPPREDWIKGDDAYLRGQR